MQKPERVGGPLLGHRNEVTWVAFLLNGKHIVSGLWDKTVRIWDAEMQVMVGGPLVGYTGDVSSVAFSPDGKYVVSGLHEETVRIWDIQMA